MLRSQWLRVEYVATIVTGVVIGGSVGNVQFSSFCFEADLFVTSATDIPARHELNCAEAVSVSLTRLTFKGSVRTA